MIKAIMLVNININNNISVGIASSSYNIPEKKLIKRIDKKLLRDISHTMNTMPFLLLSFVITNTRIVNKIEVIVIKANTL